MSNQDLPSQTQIEALLDDLKSLMLATVQRDQTPLASYTPFARSDDGASIWILVSDLAGHAKNLARTGVCSVLIIRDESESVQVYIRERLQYEMTATEIQRNTSAWNLGINALTSRQGALVETLTTLSDFRLFSLQPDSGRYIVGFGQAYELEKQTLAQIGHHLKGPTGPQISD
jgi:hypothetical protein